MGRRALAFARILAAVPAMGAACCLAVGYAAAVVAAETIAGVRRG